MKVFTNLLISLVIAGWLVALSIFSIQNIAEISLKFLIFESIRLPIGVLLSACLGTGIILGAIAPMLFAKPKSKNSKRQRLPEEDLEYLGREDPIESWEETNSKTW